MFLLCSNFAMCQHVVSMYSIDYCVCCVFLLLFQVFFTFDILVLFRGTNMAVTVATGFLACAVSSLFFGSMFVPLKKFDTKDGKILLFVSHN